LWSRVFQSAEKLCKHENHIFLFTGSCEVECFSLWRSPVNTKIRFSCLQDLVGSSVSVCREPCKRKSDFLVYRILWGRVFQSAEKPCKHENQIFLFTGSCGVECFSLRRSPVNAKNRFSCLQVLVGSSVSVCGEAL
jgi:hypothetical protein